MSARIRPAGRAAAGFTLIEAIIVVTIIGILLAIGVPRMSGWLAATRAAGATQFYAEGFTLARTMALTHNSRSRLVFSANANGQRDWRVDICFRNSTNVCSSTSTDWSSATAAAASAPGNSVNFRSITRSAGTLPASNMLTVTLGPSGATTAYFTPLGWLDQSHANAVNRVDLAPPASLDGQFRKSAVVLTLAGVAATCDPDADDGDSRICPT